MMPSILVFGRNGQVAFELQRALACLGELQAIGRDEIDFASSSAVRELLRAKKPAVIINAAAYTDVNRAESDRAAADAVNADFPAVLAEEVRSYHGKLLVHYSTDYVFDGHANQPYSEIDATNPLNHYGASKLRGEQAISNSGAPHVILRTSWVYATRGRNFPLTILRLAREGKPLRIIADQRGAPTWARMIAEATACLVTRWMEDAESMTAKSGIYHTTAQGETTWHKFAEAILLEYRDRLRNLGCTADWCSRALESLTPISSSEYPSPAARPIYSLLCNDKLCRDFGIRMPHWRTQLTLALVEYLNPADAMRQAES